MKELVYQVKFLSDVVLPATSNTEGNIEQLDFISGSNFLGIVAKNYDKFENSFDLFHSGAVKFGDAHILCDDEETYKVALSYFYEKKDNNKTIINHHLIDNFENYKQLKQLRQGYITKENSIIHIDYNYHQKSSYDKENRKSKDSSMFGYSAIRSGTKWQFSIKSDASLSSDDLALLKESVVGKKRLGKSKSAQYGLIEIEEKGEIQKIEESDSSELIVYANSRLALVDEEGNPTLNLKYLFEGLHDKNICYAKSQLRTSTFTPYNGVRKIKDYERVCINKGSVIVLQGINKKYIPSFVGAYNSEGFGHILLNPSFLLKSNFPLKPLSKTVKTKEISINSKLAKFLKNKENNKLGKLKILNEVDTFIKDNKMLYKDIKASQWGKVRSICTSANESFKEEIQEFISHGSKEWKQQQIDKLLKENYTLEFIKLISIQMPKQGSKND